MLIFIRIFAKIRFLQEVRSWKPEVFRSKIFLIIFQLKSRFHYSLFFCHCDEWRMNEEAIYWIFPENRNNNNTEKKAQTNRSIGARNHYSFFFPLFYNIFISILQGFRILEGLFTLKTINARFARAKKISIKRID